MADVSKAGSEVRPGVDDLTPEQFLGRIEALLEAARPFAAKVGYGADIDAAVETRADASEVTTILVAGEPDRGKSGLVRALVDRWDIPIETDADFYVEFSPVPDGSAESLTCRYIRDDTPEESEAPTSAREQKLGSDAFASWPASALGQATEGERLSAANFALSSPMLVGCRIFDAPGVPGLQGPEADLTLSLLPHADALLFVGDCSAPISAPEIAFLSRASSRIGVMIIVLMKRDLYQGWEHVAQEDQDLLRRRAQAFASAPMLAVSSTLARAAAGQPSDHAMTAKLLREQSGIDPLMVLLQRSVIDRRAQLETLNRVLVVRRVLAIVDGATRKAIAALEGDHGALDDLAHAEQSARNALTVDPNWGVTLHNQISALNVRLEVQIAEAYARVNDEFTDHIMNCRKEELERLPQDLSARLTAELNSLRDFVFEHLVQAVEKAVGEIPELIDSETLADSLGHEDANLDVANPNARIRGARGAQARFSMLSGFSSGRSLVSLIPGMAFTPYAFAGGVAMAIIGRKLSVGVQERGDLRSWMSSQLALQRTRISSTLKLEIQSTESELLARIRAQLERRDKDLTQTVTRLRETANAGEEKRKAAIAEMQSGLNELIGLRHEAEALLSAVQRVPAAPAATQ